MDNLLNKLGSWLETYVLAKAPFLRKVPIIKNPRGFSIIVVVIFALILGPLLSWLIPPLKVPAPHVSLAAEPLLENGPTWFTNSLLTTFLVDIVIVIGAALAASGIKLVPEKHWSNIIEWMIEGMYNLTESISGHNVRKFFPWVMTIFIFVIVSNYFGLLPGVGSIMIKHGQSEAAHAVVLDSQLASAGSAIPQTAALQSEGQAEVGAHGERVPIMRSPSADLNMTLALAFISVIMTQVWGVQALGIKYFGKFFRNPFNSFIDTVVGFFELLSELAKIISFSFRLFGNIFAGEIVLAVMAFLVMFLLPSVFYGLELFVGFIQALVFMLLTVAFFSMATISHDEHH